MRLLGREENSTDPQHNKEISTIKWTHVVQKAKRSSISFVFLKQVYSRYKYALESEESTRILVEFYNTIIRRGIYPKR